jgi:hypothetical protein
VKDGYGQALMYFGFAIAVLLVIALLPRIQSLSLSPTGGINVTLKDLKDNVDTLVKQTNTIQSSSVGEGGGKKTKATTRGFTNETAEPTRSAGNESHPDDPQKGKWGGLAERNDKILKAKVEPSAVKGLYEVTLTVESTNPKSPLKGFVKFHLHNTFRNPDPVIAVQNDKAVLKLTRVYGAFTVGAEADDGQTWLEKDLAEMNEAPGDFRSR